MKASLLHLPEGGGIADSFRRGDEAVVGLFGSHPADPDAWIRRAAEVDASAAARADRGAVADAIRAYQRGLPSHPAVELSLERLARADSLAVVGGQQAGLFGGALLIFYKALTVIQTAKFAEDRLGRPVVPIFWIAGEDHDYDEANHVNVQGTDGALLRVRAERPQGSRQAVSRTRLTPDIWAAALADLEASLPDTEFKPKLLEKLREHTADSPTLSVAFARWLSDWFGPHGLLLLDADHEALRALEGPMFRRLIEDNDRLEAALAEGEAAVTALGMPLQAATVPGNANLFLHHEQGRLLLHKQEGAFTDRKGFVSLSAGELLDIAERQPDTLSTNALSRPLMQEYVLPVLAVVLGPSELAYWSVLGPAFRRFGMRMPLPVPRQSFTYLELGVEKLLGKFGLTPEAAMTGWEQRRADWLAAQDDGRLERLFAEAKERFAALYAPVVEAVSALQPGLAQLSETNRDKIIEQIAYLESRSMDALAKRHEAGLRQWDRIRGALSPGGKPQERVYGTIQYWNRYGPEWMTRWFEVPFDVTGSHRLAVD